MLIQHIYVLNTFKCPLIAFLCILTSLSCACDRIHGKLLNAIRIVESGNNASAIGDKGEAVGAYQLHKIYVDDANRILGVHRYKYDDRKDITKSTEIVKVVLNHYAKQYERTTGKPCTDEVIARIHNGGPLGYKKATTLAYWIKVKKYL